MSDYHGAIMRIELPVSQIRGRPLPDAVARDAGLATRAIRHLGAEIASRADTEIAHLTEALAAAEAALAQEREAYKSLTAQWADAIWLLTRERARAERLADALREMLAEKIDYMTINKLGDPGTQHTVKLALAALEEQS